MKKILFNLINLLKEKKEFTIAAIILVIVVVVVGSFLSVSKKEKNAESEYTVEDTKDTKSDSNSQSDSSESNSDSSDSDNTDSDSDMKNSGENILKKGEIEGQSLMDYDQFRGVWFSYYDWIALQTDDEEEFRKKAKGVMEQVKSMDLNTIFVHVHSHSDSYYPSAYFPMSKYATGSMGKSLSYDPLEIMIEEAHKRGIHFHAWLNPYRITSDDGKTEDGALSFQGVSWEEVPEDSIVKKWYNSSETSRNVLYHDGNYFLNPSKEKVRQYLCDTVKELVTTYDVDGVHFDDYFYPSIDDSNPDMSFDLTEYEASGSGLSVSEWRRQNVSDTVKMIYQTVKEADEEVTFGISPAGNLDNLRSDSMYFTDIDTWLSEEGYLDYVIPQIYWGFEQKNKDGSLSSSAYENCLNRWSALPRRDGVDMYIGLALYRCGLDISDNNSPSEWVSHSDIILRQVQSLENKENVSGFCLFDYRDLSRQGAKTEVENLYNFISQEETN